MKLKILTPERSILEKEVISATLPGKEGELTVLDGHDFLMAEISRGRLYFRYNDDDNKLQRDDYTIGEGLAQVTKDTAIIFTASANHI